MIEYPLTKPVRAPQFTCYSRRVSWSFFDRRNNPLMQAQLKDGSYQATITPAGILLNSPQNQSGWAVKFDQQGYILRGNGRRYLQNGKPVNALRNNYRRERCVPFWDLVFQRDRAPIEGHRELTPYNFNQALSHFIKSENPFLFECFARLPVSGQGEISFHLGRSHPILWSLTLFRRFAGRLVLAVPLRQEGKLALSTFSESDRRFINTFHYDAENQGFYEQRSRYGSLHREYFTRVPESRHLVHRSLDLYFNERASLDSVLVLEDNGNDLLIRHGHKADFIPTHPIENQGKTIGFLVGDIWPKGPFPITGRIKRENHIFWDKNNQSFFFFLFGKQYRVLRSDAERLGLKNHGPIFMTLEDGFPTEIESAVNGEKVLYRLARDTAWKIVSSARASIPSRLLKDGILIIEGIQSCQREFRGGKYRYEGYDIGFQFRSLGIKVEGEFKPRPLSLVVSIEGRRIKVLYYSFADRFCAADRRVIQTYMQSGEDVRPVKIKRQLLSNREKKIASTLAAIINGYSKPLNPIVTELAAFLEDRRTTAEDIAHALAYLYLAAMKNDRAFTNHLLEVFANFYKVLVSISASSWPKLTMGLILAQRSEEGKRAVVTTVRNGLASEEREKLLLVIRSNKNLAAKLNRAMASISAE